MKATSAQQLGHVTYSEILQQCTLWPDTVNRVCTVRPSLDHFPDRPLFTGAGTSAYASSAVAASWPDAEAVPTTDLLLAPELCGQDRDWLISLARSGNSPESVGVVRRIEQLRPSVRQLAISCNADGELASLDSIKHILLDPRTNDRGLAMTGSFSNLVLAGLTLKHHEMMSSIIEHVSSRAKSMLPQIEAAAADIANFSYDRAVILGSSSLVPLAQETALKITELTGGAITTVAESFLGLRHGPMSYLRKNTLVVCFLSSSEYLRRYELDLIRELQSKRLGRIICIGLPEWVDGTEECLAPVAPELPDALRTPFEVLFSQLLAFHLSLRSGLDPDEPSPDGVIHRIVQGVRLYEV